MSDNVLPGPITADHSLKEAVCVNVNKIYDSCRDKDCIKNVEVYLSSSAQTILNNTNNVKAEDARIVFACVDVSPVPFNKGFFSVDVTYYFEIKFEACLNLCNNQHFTGLAMFTKKVILFGSEGTAKIFDSKCCCKEAINTGKPSSNAPQAVVEAVNPIVLCTKIASNQDKCYSCCPEFSMSVLPNNVCNFFDEELISCSDKKLLVTLGLFSMIRLERPVQLLIPTFDFCMPSKECSGLCDDDPCNAFAKFKFPNDEFFPPRFSNNENCGCSCSDNSCNN